MMKLFYQYHLLLKHKLQKCNIIVLCYVLFFKNTCDNAYRFRSLLAATSGLVTTKSTTLAIVSTDSTVVYYKFTNGLLKSPT
jgi:hypothetical protein